MPTWQDSKKIYDPVENRSVQVDFINTMIAESPLYATYYDVANVEISGGKGVFAGTQMPEDSPINWRKGSMLDNWPASEDMIEELPLIEYGLFGDVSSRDFARLAFDAPDILEKHLQSKIDNVYGQFKRITSQVILHHLCDTNAYATNAKFELDKDYFTIDTDQTKLAENQAKAINIIAKILSTAYEMIDYETKWNKKGKEGVITSLDDLYLVLDHSVDTFLNTYGLAQVFNSGYLDLKTKIGKVIIAKLPTVTDTTVKPKPVWDIDNATKLRTSTVYKATDGQIGDWRILLHGKHFHKIRDVINVPNNDEGVFIETGFYRTQLRNFIGKWFFAIQGNISFVNAAAWTCKTT